MHNPYTPPKAELDIEIPRGKGARYYRITNWIYGAIVSLLFVFLLVIGAIDPELPDLVVMIFIFAPVGGYVVANYITGNGYKAGLIIHLIVVLLLIAFVLFTLYAAHDALPIFVVMLAINLFSVITNAYFRKKGRNWEEPTNTGMPADS